MTRIIDFHCRQWNPQQDIGELSSGFSVRHLNDRREKREKKILIFSSFFLMNISPSQSSNGTNERPGAVPYGE